MTGRILTTSLKGGHIRADDGTRFFFAWTNCLNFGPSDCGHDSKVQFTDYIDNGKPIALRVTLDD